MATLQHPLHELGVQIDPTAPIAPDNAGMLFTAGKGKGYNLYITKGTLSLGRAGEMSFKGIDKRMARKICKEHGATPHNF